MSMVKCADGSEEWVTDEDLEAASELWDKLIKRNQNDMETKN